MKRPIARPTAPAPDAPSEALRAPRAFAPTQAIESDTSV